LRSDRICAVSLALALVFAAGATAVVLPKTSDVEPFRHSTMDFTPSYKQVTSLSGIDTAPLMSSLSALGVAPHLAYLDVRGNRWGTLMPSQPLLPGNGVGNSLVWQNIAGGEPQSLKELEATAWAAFVGYIGANADSLRIDVSELTPRGKVTVHDDGEIIQIYAPRIVQGVQVRGSFISGVISHGNLILFGATKWGDVDTSVNPALDVDQAFSAMTSQLDYPIGASRKAGFLNLVPVGAGRGTEKLMPGTGYGHRLAWVLAPRIEGETGRWEALVDAHTGEVFALEDLNQYGAATRRRVLGGVLPITNDGTPPDGVEQASWPMPWVDITSSSGTTFSDVGGNLNTCTDGTISTSLDGQFMLMNDNCGAINESSGSNLNLGTSGGTDCVVPPGSDSLGNTHSSRSGFFEMNQVKAQARGQLPSNPWPQAQLQSNMNINSSCNAFWDGSTVNFYRSSAACGNTGELAGVFDHEWGHGMDNNDANPTISDPGEGIADIYAALRLNDSCMGRGFIIGGTCNGYGDPCTVCSGVRDIDWANRASGVPHDVTWSIANCGNTSHCRGAVYAEAVWDLFNRDLTSAPFSLDHNTAIELATRLTYIGAGPVGSWFLNTPPFGGCNADGGYLNYLAADDDNGSLADGTPHMSAIFDAYDRHEAACGSPTVTNAGCGGGPSTAPAISMMTAIDKGATFDISPVSGAERYDIFRTDGVFDCDQGKIKVGEIDVITGPESTFNFVDNGLQNGREYWYTAIAVGSSDACTSPAATCTAVTPANGPNLALATEATSVVENIGDGDDFIDNCEEITASFDVSSIGVGNQTNVRIVSIENLTHPSTVITTGVPSTISGFMASCAISTASINFQPQGMAFNDTFQLRVGITSDQLDPIVKTGIVSIGFVESDLESFASKTFTFEVDGEDWTVTTGSFDRTGGGGGDGTTFSRDSTAFVDQNCDTIRSPLLALESTSTLSLWNNYDIEPLSGGTWYDRANVGLVDTGNNRTLVTPDSGRLYNADSSGPGTYGGCNEPEEGWADINNTWGTSSWSAAAFGAVAPAGLSQLEVIYGTDAALANRGFWFDEVTVTDGGVQIEDASSDACSPPIFVFADGFESGDTSAWGSTVP